MSATHTPTGSASRTFAGDTSDTRLALSGYLFGCNASWMLLAFIIGQTYTYYQNSIIRKDRAYLRIGVYVLVLSQVIQTVADSFGVYRIFVSLWGSPDANEDRPASIAVNFTLITCCITALVVQSFYIVRIWKFGMMMTGPVLKFAIGCMCIFTGALLLLACGLALVSSIISTLQKASLDGRPTGLLEFTSSIYSIGSGLADCLISASMVAILLHARSSASFEETRMRFSMILRATIQTGFTTTALTVCNTIINLSPGRSANFGSFIPYLIGKSYVISLLSVLNARIPEAPVVRTGTIGPNRAFRPAAMSPGLTLAIPPTANLEMMANNLGLARRIRSLAKAITNRGLRASPRNSDLELQTRTVIN